MPAADLRASTADDRGSFAEGIFNVSDLFLSEQRPCHAQCDAQRASHRSQALINLCAGKLKILVSVFHGLELRARFGYRSGNQLVQRLNLVHMAAAIHEVQRLCALGRKNVPGRGDERGLGERQRVMRIGPGQNLLLVSNTAKETIDELYERVGCLGGTVTGHGERLARANVLSLQHFVELGDPVDGDVWYESTIDSARGMGEVAEVARQGVTVLGRDSPAGVRLENMARFGDHISESIIRAAEQVRELLYTTPAASTEDNAAD